MSSAFIFVIFLIIILAAVLSYLLIIRKRHIQKEIDWSQYFTKDQQNYFLTLIHKYFNNKNIDIIIQKGAVAVKEKNGLMGLDNLVRVCHKKDRNKWEEIITEHFDLLCSALKKEDKLISELADFSRAKDFLAVRIFPSDYLDSVGNETKRNLIYRKDLEGTITTLVFDLPSSIRTVTVKDTIDWEKSTGELFKQALANIFKKHPPEMAEIDLTSNIKATAFQGENVLTASHILCLHEYRKCIGIYGSLVAIPHRHILICFPIEDVSIIDAINSLIAMVQNMHKEGPGSISPNIYWYYKGLFTHLPYFIWKEHMDFCPPQEFVNLLNIIVDKDDEK